MRYLSVEVAIGFDKVQVGDTVVVSAGESIPVDGTITDGLAEIDQRAPPAQPAQKGVGEQVFAGTVVLSGKIHICVEKAGTDTISAQIGEILNSADNFTQSIVSRGDRIADKSAIPMLGAYGLTLPNEPFATTILNSNFGHDTLACREMRVLAPLGMLSTLNSASEKGILIKDGRVLDLLKQVDTVVFDTACVQPENRHLDGRSAACGANPYLCWLRCDERLGLRGGSGTLLCPLGYYASYPLGGQTNSPHCPRDPARSGNSTVGAAKNRRSAVL